MANFETLPIERAAHPDANPESSREARRSGSRAALLARDLIALTKPRITLMVLVTGGAGMCVAPGALAAKAMWLSLLGTALVVASANVLNMWWERALDGKMTRTKNRPLPAGRMAPNVALIFGIALGLISAPILFAVNPITGLLGMVALITYVAIYTPLKRYTWLALLVGAVPGAMPPLMGWTTVTGRIDAAGLLLFGVLFLWQIPHFAAITVFRREEYARAGLQVISVHRGERAAKVVIFSYSFLLVAATLLVFPFGVSGVRYFVVAAVLGAIFIALGARGLTRGQPDGKSDRWAKQLFGYSIVYLVLLLGSMLLDRVVA